MKLYKEITVLLFFFWPILMLPQEELKLEEAIAIAMERNYDLKIARNNVAIATVEADLLNSGYLPRVSASGGINYSNENQSVTFADGTTTAIDGAETESYNASLTAEYTLFDGMERKFKQDRNNENLLLNELQHRQEIENTLISIYENYFNVAFQKQVVENLKLNLTNSTDRLDRAIRQLKYGQGTTLDELNAQVDLNNDSISYIEAVRDLNNLKRNFNLVLGRDVRTLFTIDTIVSFQNVLSLEKVLAQMKKSNVQLVLAARNITLSELDLKINRATFLPKLSGSVAYQWNESLNPPTSFALENETYGLNLGLNLSWNIFDGGSSRTKVKKTKIDQRNREIELIRIKETVLADTYNAYETYSIAQYTLTAEAKNVGTNALNFQRTQKQYSLGQVTTVEFRQAQINLFNARNNYAKAKYDLKLAEIRLLQLGGMLIN
ncbi:MAG: TolC family protein [Saonia sp.]